MFAQHTWFAQHVIVSLTSLNDIVCVHNHLSRVVGAAHVTTLYHAIYCIINTHLPKHCIALRQKV